MHRRCSTSLILALFGLVQSLRLSCYLFMPSASGKCMRPQVLSEKKPNKMCFPVDCGTETVEKSMLHILCHNSFWAEAGFPNGPKVVAFFNFGVLDTQMQYFLHPPHGLSCHISHMLLLSSTKPTLVIRIGVATDSSGLFVCARFYAAEL